MFDGGGAFVGEVEVVAVAAFGVGVAGDFEGAVGAGFEDAGDDFELSFGAWVEDVGVVFEVEGDGFAAFGVFDEGGVWEADFWGGFGAVVEDFGEVETGDAPAVWVDFFEFEAEFGIDVGLFGLDFGDDPA